MGFLTKLERISEKYIEGFFKTKYADHVQPVEIAKLLAREMRDNKTVSVSSVYVPNQYTVFLGREDYLSVDPVRQSLSGEMQEFLRQKAVDKGYEMAGEVRVSFGLDEELPLGVISVESSLSEDFPVMGEPETSETKRPAEYTMIAVRERFYKNSRDTGPENTLTRLPIPMQSIKAFLVREAGTMEGQRFPLGERGVIVGRRRSNDVCLEDTNISRVHASIDYLEGCYYITDLGSTNGTYVNEARISKKKLSDGDLIKMGTTILKYEAV